jgi:hypothetical protein
LKTSRYTALDNAAMEKVKQSLRLKNAPGEIRVYTKEFTFRIR